MSKLSPRKFSLEDFKEQSQWIGKLLLPINDFFQQLYQSWNNGITIEDNLYQEIKEVKFTVDATTFPLKFKTKFNEQPKGLLVIYTQDSTGAGLTSAPWVNWSYNSSLITISNISGLTSGLTYTIRFLVIYR